MKKITLTAATLALLGFSAGLAASPAQAKTSAYNTPATASAEIENNGAHLTTFTYVGGEAADEPSNTSGKFSKFGVMDFTGMALGGVATGASNLQLTMLEDMYFTDAGAYNVYLATDTVTAIDSTTPLLFNATATTDPIGVGPQLGSKYLLGTGTFANVDQSQDVVNLSLSGAATGAFLSELNAGKVRLLVTAADTGSVSFLGPNSASAPVLSYTATLTPAAAVPEGSPLALFGLGLLPVGLLARRRRAAK